MIAIPGPLQAVIRRYDPPASLFDYLVFAANGASSASVLFTVPFTQAGLIPNFSEVVVPVLLDCFAKFDRLVHDDVFVTLVGSPRGCR